jgi:hypothetical protein
MTGQQYAFEDFPRKELRFVLSRRQLFTDLIMQALVMVGEADGGMGFRLSQLGSLPDAELAHLVPAIRPDCAITSTDEFVWGKLPDEPQAIPLFPRQPATLCAFNAMNGRTALGAIGRKLAHEMGWEPERGYAFTRGLFLHLVQLRVCVIADAGAP